MFLSFSTKPFAEHMMLLYVASPDDLVIKDLEIMEMFLLEPRGKCRLQAKLLTVRNSAASRYRLGGWKGTFEEDSAASLKYCCKRKVWNWFSNINLSIIMSVVHLILLLTLF